MRSGCMWLNHTGVSYQFQMSAVSVVGGELLEGSLSDITAFTILYVPKPGIFYANACIHRSINYCT